MSGRSLRALLVDPSLFTAPYDAALHDGLRAAGVAATWAVRPIRRGDRQEIPAAACDPFFYRRVDELRWLRGRPRALAKGLAHTLGLIGLIRRVVRLRPDVVHVQWTVVPVLDSLAMLAMRLFCPVVLTVHDTEAFNGERISLWQNVAFDLPMRIADEVIVHTRAGEERLRARGLRARKISVIAHGPLTLRAALPEREGGDDRWTFLLFGELKPYKGIDVMLEAIGRLPSHVRERARFIVAGRPRMELDALRARAAALGIEGALEWRAFRHSEEQMAELFARADCFLFPYRQVDASGVYFLVKSCAKWIIASRVGAFAEDLQEGAHGTFVPPGDAAALAAALATCIESRPAARGAAPSAAWAQIGRHTRAVYERALAGARRGERLRASSSAVAANGGTLHRPRFTVPAAREH